MTSSAEKTAPVPDQDESFERYTVRAHKALLAEIPDPDERNSIVWDGWREHRGAHPGEEVAAKTFDPAKFVRSDNHCEFREHETVGRDGKPKKYTVDELSRIVRQHNHEITEHKAFPALAEHHTPDEPGGKEPAVVGQIGPFRLGMIGVEEPMWAVFGDEHHRRDSLDLLSRKPYRSPEVFNFKGKAKDGGDLIRFHPIAAVGAQAPRLTMPAKFTEPTTFRVVETDSGEAEKYVAAAVDWVRPEKYAAPGASAGAFAGGSNTFTKQPEKYGPQAGAGSMAPEDIASIMQALQSTPEFVWLRRAMEEEKAFADPTAEEMGIDPPEGDMGMPGQGAPMDGGTDAGDADAGPMGGGDDQINAGQPGGNDQGFSSNANPDEDEPEDKMTQNANEVTVEKYTALVRSQTEQVEKYTTLKQSHDQLMAAHASLAEKYAISEKRSTDAQRSLKWDELDAKLPGFLDLEEEKKATLYSLGANVSDEAFDERYAMAEKYAEKAAAAQPIPRGVMPERYTRGDEAADKYEQRLAEVATQVHSEGLQRGKSMNYSECVAEAEKRIKSNGHANAAA